MMVGKNGPGEKGSSKLLRLKIRTGQHKIKVESAAAFDDPEAEISAVRIR
ncbi:MAG: hypothetical protein BMS9Abin02_1823 [Anaerolineae bacterium]|nr:MAG: hypothetical protein BMS9Abin02_1823 [Anaerolineae bacterium]